MPSLQKRIVVGEKLVSHFLSKNCQDNLKKLSSGEKAFVVTNSLPAKLASSSDGAATVGLGIIAHMNNHPVAYDCENDGQVERIVKPKKGKLDEKSSEGAVALPLHTDLAFLRFPTETKHPYRSVAPDFLTLVCISNAQEIPTRVISLADLKAALPKATYSALFQPKFTVDPPESVKGLRPSEYIPLMFLHATNKEMIRYNSAKLSGVDDEAKHHLKVFEEATSDPKLGNLVCLSPGQALTFNNRQVIHGRPAIDIDKLNVGQERELVRVYSFRPATEKNAIHKGSVIQDCKPNNLKGC